VRWATENAKGPSVEMGLASLFLSRVKQRGTNRSFVRSTRGRIVLLGLAAVCLVGVAARAAANPLARWETRRWVDGLHGIEGDFLDARLSFFPLVYRVTHLKLSQPERQTKEPLLYADELSLRLLWGQLLTGNLVARIQGLGVKVVLEQPAPGTPARLPDLANLIPVRILLERLEAKKGEVLYEWVYQKGRPTMWFHDIEATLENIGSRPQLASGWMTLAASGVVQRSGRMSVVVQAEPFAEPFTFRGNASLDGFDVSQMNALIDSQKGVKLSPGVFSLQMAFDCKQGRLEGRVEPHLRDTEVVAQDSNLISAFTALFGRISMALAPQPDGTTATGAILVRDELTEPNRQLLLSMEKVVENGFLLGLQESLRRVYAGAPSANTQAGKKRTELQTGK
jgi:hypothetical protein